METGEIPLPLKVKVEGRNLPIKSVHFPSDKFTSALEKLAFISGTGFHRRGGQLILGEYDDGPIDNRNFLVPPTFMTWLIHFSGRQMLETRGNLTPSFQRADLLTKGETVEDRLEEFGVQFHYSDRGGNALSLRIESERIDATGRHLGPKKE